VSAADGPLANSTDRVKIHIPYRENILTRVLKTGIGGNAKSLVICNIALAQSRSEGTTNALLFAQNAVRVRHETTVNEVEDKQLLARYLEERELAERFRASLAVAVKSEVR